MKFIATTSPKGGTMTAEQITKLEIQPIEPGQERMVSDREKTLNDLGRMNHLIQQVIDTAEAIERLRFQIALRAVDGGGK